MGEPPRMTLPRPWATAIVGVIAFGAGGAFLFFTFLEQHSILSRLAGSIVGGGFLAGAAIGARYAPRFRPLVAFTLGISTAFVGGPVALAVTLFVKGLEEGAGLRAFGAVIVAILGMACGWFISIPIGVGLGLFLALLTALVDLLPGSRIDVRPPD